MLYRKPILAVIVAAFAFAGGCNTPFLHTAAAPGAVIQDAGLVGEWVSTGPTTSRAVIDQPVNGAYPVALTVQSGVKSATSLSLELTLTEIGGARYADLFLARADRDQLVQRYGFLAIPVHQIMKVSRDGSELKVWTFDGAWLEKSARGETFAHDRVPVGGTEVAMVTATTEQVRDLIARLGDDTKAFGEAMVFRRVVK
ncbi:MAG: hypothetical protein AABZ53_10145 [Planctomycetota bacterium]